MKLLDGIYSRISNLFRRPEAARRLILLVSLTVGILISARWCTPDGGPPAPLDSFILSLRSLDTLRAGKVRVLHFGDSHIASDTESSVVRSYLQARFGDGGPGLLLPWEGPHIYSDSYTYGNSFGWQRVHPSYSSPVEDTGLALSYIQADSPDQYVWIQATASDYRVEYLAQPGGGMAEFLLDGQPLGQKSMSANFPQVEEVLFQAPGPDLPHRFEIRTLDSGSVRILGVSVEKSGPGLVYSALGLVGARAEYLLKCRGETFEAQVASEHPDLIIMGYGTNETSGSYLDENAYETSLMTIISRMRRSAPQALIVLLTPPDRGDNRPGMAQHYERVLQQVIAVQRDVAERDDAVVLDLYTAMGGVGSAEHWATVQPALARPDMTHFTNEGYNLLGRYIAGGILKLYESGGEEAQFSTASFSGGRNHRGVMVPPLYSGPTSQAAMAGRGEGSSDFSPPAAEIFYFLKNDGEVVVTNDLSTIDTREGKVISAQEAGCLLRGKAAPCDNVLRW